MLVEPISGDAMVRMKYHVYMDALDGSIAQRKTNESLVNICLTLVMLTDSLYKKNQALERKLVKIEKSKEKK